MSDRTRVVQYTLKDGGTRSPKLCYKAWELWQIAIDNNIQLKAAHIAGWLNILLDQFSRVDIRQMEWEINDVVLDQVFSNMGQTIGRSVCIVSEPHNGNSLFLAGSSSSIGNGRIDNTVE